MAYTDIGVEGEGGQVGTSFVAQTVGQGGVVGEGRTDWGCGGRLGVKL